MIPNEEINDIVNNIQSGLVNLETLERKFLDMQKITEAAMKRAFYHDNEGELVLDFYNEFSDPARLEGFFIAHTELQEFIVENE